MANSLTPQFFDFEAAADKMTQGAIWLPQFQSDILDLVRRRGVFGQRIQPVPATGSPSRYFEQQAIPNNQGFVDPQSLNSVTAANNGTALRVEQSQALTAVVGQINFGLFDIEVTAQQGVFDQLQAKDLKDMVTGCLLVEDKAFWNGTGSSNQYTGFLNVAGLTTGTIAPGVSIVDSIRTQIAVMVNNQTYAVRPTAIYMNSIAADYLQQEMKNNTTLIAGTVSVAAGIDVPTIHTAAGPLPVIVEWALPTLTGGVTGTQYPIAIVSENLLEYHYVTTPTPRVFQLGLVSTLAQQLMAVKFGGLATKGASYAHALLKLQR